MEAVIGLDGACFGKSGLKGKNGDAKLIQAAGSDDDAFSAQAEKHKVKAVAVAMMIALFVEYAFEEKEIPGWPQSALCGRCQKFLPEL